MLLPAAERRGEIHFYIAKSLPYMARLAIAFVLMMLGICVQLIGAGTNVTVLGLGFVFLMAGVILLLVKGYDNKIRVVPGSAEWRPARPAEIQKILDLNAKQAHWDQDFFDVTSGIGCLGFFVALIVIGAAGFFLSSILPPVIALIIVGDAVVLLFPFWWTGVRSVLKNDRLIVKINQLTEVEKAFDGVAKKEEEEFGYQLQIEKAAGDAGDVPHDVKALVHFKNAPETFLGLQMQISINSVQGSDYPYFYCVLVAKREFGLIQKPPIAMASKIVVEPQRQDDVDVVVIRQETTKNSGYHTKNQDAVRIFRHALEQARMLIGS